MWILTRTYIVAPYGASVRRFYSWMYGGLAWLSTYEPSRCDRNEHGALKANLFTPSSLNLALMLCRSTIISGWWWWSQFGQRQVATANEFKLKLLCPKYRVSTWILCSYSWKMVIVSLSPNPTSLFVSVAPHQWPWFSTFAMNNGNREHVSVCKSAPPPQCGLHTQTLSLLLCL